MRDGDHVLIGGSGGGHAVPEAWIGALAERFRATGRPRDLSLMSVVAIGDWKTTGFGRLAQPGLVKRVVSAGFNNCPAIGAMAAADEIEAYTLPQGALSQLCRDMAAGRPGLLTRTGLHTFVDPRRGGGKQSARTTEDLVELVTLHGEEYLFYRAQPIDLAVIRGTTADERGNVTMEDEPYFGEQLSIAQAARNRGATVVCQVARVAAAGSLSGQAGEGPGRAGGLPGRRARRVADLRHPVRPGLRRRRPAAGRGAPAAPARHPQGHRAAGGARAVPGRRRQPRLRRLERDRSGGGRGGHPPGRHADGGAGDRGRRAGGRQRRGRRVQLRRDDRPALPVRLLRRRRARHRVPLVRRGRRRGERQREPLRPRRQRARRVREHQPGGAKGRVLRDPHGGRTRHRAGRGERASAWSGRAGRRSGSRPCSRSPSAAATRGRAARRSCT